MQISLHRPVTFTVFFISSILSTYTSCKVVRFTKIVAFDKQPNLNRQGIIWTSEVYFEFLAWPMSYLKSLRGRSPSPEVDVWVALMSSVVI